MTLLERTQAVLDGMDTGCTPAEVRADVEALRGELVRRESAPVPTMLAPTAADHRLMALAEARPRRWFGLRRSS